MGRKTKQMMKNKGGSEINAMAFRQIADRIDPNVGMEGVARYEQETYGRFLYPLFQVKHECQTACCIAGHAFILASGKSAWMNWMMGTDADLQGHISVIALRYLGLSNEQADALFRGVVKRTEIQDVFGVKLKSRRRILSLDSAVMATALRQIAEAYG